MSSSYHQPDAPNSPVDDSDSDLDLDIQELDPITTSTTAGPSSSRKERKPQEGRRATHIPLRNLRMGGLRGLGKRNRGYGDLGRDRDINNEDLRGLLNDEPGLDGAGRSSRGIEDGAPLLAVNGHRRRPSMDTFNKLGSHIRLPSFLSATAGSQALPDDAEVQAEEHDPASSRTISVGTSQTARFPANAVSNAKYTPVSFLPLTLYNEFSFFFNMYFLLVALSQAIPPLRIGYLSTYVVPLAFVLAVTLGKEAFDDIGRRRRDNEANSEGYTVLCFDKPGVGNAERYHAKKKLKSKQNAKSKRKSLVEPDRLSDIQEEEDAAESRGVRQSPSSPSSSIQEVIRKSRDLKVGDVLKLGRDQRVPADVVILKSYTNESASTTEEIETVPLAQSLLVEPISDPPIDTTAATVAEGHESTSELGNTPAADAGGVGETFIRTDQLDGETDWKLRLGSPLTQSLEPSEFVRLRIVASKPDKKVNEFVGTVELLPKNRAGYDPYLPKTSPLRNVVYSEQPSSSANSAPLTIDNTAWANTVLASNATTLAVVVYTGSQTRSALSTSPSRSKTGLLEYEINSLTKILCALTATLSIVLVALEGFEHVKDYPWYVKMMRFLVLFSTIVPISLRVNLDMGKSVYSWFIQRDTGMPGAVVRTSTIPEELGRIEYLLSDKTGTLTQNEMEMKKIHVGTVSYANEAMDEVASYIKQGFSVPLSMDSSQLALITPSSTFVASTTVTATRTRREIGSRVRDVVLALAICHNVTPTMEEENGQMVISYQASSPDEIAIVKWTEAVGLRLAHRDRKGMTLHSVDTGRPVVRVRILEVFPFTSDGKRMGIIVQFLDGSETAGSVNIEAGELWFYQKGADTVMGSIVAANDWLDEETANMAREGLRTLVVGRKRMSVQQYQEFAANYKDASISINGRDAAMGRVVSHYLERDLELLGVTGVEDKLQRDVKPSLELLRNAGIKIWMLTGDKVETARCVAVSAKLVARGQYIHTIAKLKRKDNAQDHLDFLRGKKDSALLIDGESLALLLTHFRTEFISLAVLLPAVIACRCSPTQKADIAILIREFTKKRICCIGDGGNDVSMIQAADVGVGIVGKEGRQASLAADFSITQFCHLTKLLVWHGRNSYKRSAKLAQFVIHRGLIISVCQTMYSIAIKFEPEGLYIDWLMVGYATVYTMAPVFSLVLDKDVDENLANLYPELYKELTSGSSLSYRTFFVWVFVSIYQGGMIQGLSQLLTETNSPKMVAVSYTVLVLNELCMVAFEITTWHPVMIICLVGTLLLYLGSIPFLGRYFDLAFIVTWYVPHPSLPPQWS